MGMKLVFCGTPMFAVPSLERLVAAGHESHAGGDAARSTSGPRHDTDSAARETSRDEAGTSVVQPEKIKKNAEFQKQLTALKPEAIIVVGYGRIIPPWMLQLPLLGNINVHGSLLPKYRGAAPIQWAIANGETVTGVTTMRIDEGLDTGDMLLQREMEILPDDTAVTVAPRMAWIGAELLVETLDGLRKHVSIPFRRTTSRRHLRRF